MNFFQSKTMNLRKKQLVRAIGFLMAVLITFAVIPVFSFADETQTDSASTVVNRDDSRVREINVVFDNSSSMFVNFVSGKTFDECPRIDRWCYAKYAMEAFASTLNDKDVLKIYPLNPITTDGSATPSTSPISILGSEKENGIKKIHNMYSSSHDGSTPFAPIEEAAAGFSSGSNTSKYLVIITDGVFQNADGSNKAEAEVKTVLESIQARGIQVLYLRIGKEDVINADILYKRGIEDTSDIIDAVNDVCNRIFERVELDDDYIDDGKLELKISMRKLIVFVQGKDAKTGALTSPAGATVQPESVHISYSDKSSFDGGTVEDSLNGYVATYSSSEYMQAGTYSLNYSGDIKVFYEPAIDVVYELRDAVTGDPVEIDENNAISAGDYIINMQFIDSKTGEDVTDSELLKGKKNDNELYAYLKDADGNNLSEKLKNGETVSFPACESAQIEVTGIYLDDYIITNTANGSSQMFKIEEKPFACKISVEDDYFCTRNADSWNSFFVTFTVNGEPASAGDFAKINISKEDVVIEGSDVDFDLQRDEENQRYLITLKLRDGKVTSETCGKGSIVVTASCRAGGENATDSDKHSFTIRKYSKLEGFLRIFIPSLILLLIIIYFLFIRKVYPKRMWIDIDGEGLFALHVSGGTVNVCPSGSYERLTLKLRKNCNFWRRSIQKRPSVVVSGIEPSDDIESISFKGHAFSPDGTGVWHDSSKPDGDIQANLNILLSGNSNSISWQTEETVVDGNIKLKK